MLAEFARVHVVPQAVDRLAVGRGRQLELRSHGGTQRREHRRTLSSGLRSGERESLACGESLLPRYNSPPRRPRLLAGGFGYGTFMADQPVTSGQFIPLPQRHGGLLRVLGPRPAEAGAAVDPLVKLDQPIT